MRNTLTFRNENNKLVTFQVYNENGSVEIIIHKDDQVVEQTFTPFEAEVLRRMLDMVPIKPAVNKTWIMVSDPYLPDEGNPS